MMKKLIFIIILLLPLQLMAQEGGNAYYVKVTPGLVVNYGEPSSSRLRYLKVSVHVRVRNADHANVIEHHLPALQDLLVSLLSAQDEEKIRSVEGKEEVRLEALEKMQKIIEKEEGESVVQDLLFLSLIHI